MGKRSQSWLCFTTRKPGSLTEGSSAGDVRALLETRTLECRSRVNVRVNHKELGDGFWCIRSHAELMARRDTCVQCVCRQTGNLSLHPLPPLDPMPCSAPAFLLLVCSQLSLLSPSRLRRPTSHSALTSFSGSRNECLSYQGLGTKDSKIERQAITQVLACHVSRFTSQRRTKRDARQKESKRVVT